MTSIASIQDTLEAAGVEIYRAKGDEVQLAERVRLHIMDSGVRVLYSDDALRIRFTARTQRSDFPNADSETLFTRVRESVGPKAVEQGYEESDASVHEVKDPVDDSHVLDVWHEVVYEKATDIDHLIDDVRWALAIEKYVSND